MKYKGIIFDLDGVICTTDSYHYQAWKKVAEAKGIYFDEEINSRLRGVSRMESLEIILENCESTLSKEEKEALANEKNNIYLKLLEEISQKDLSEKVKDTLDELRSKGYLLAIGSSSKNAKFILKQLGLNNYFDAVSDGTNIKNSKPNPEVFLKAAEFLKLSPSECLVVEDAKAGIDAAASGGFDSAGILDACAYKKTTYPLKNFESLREIL